MRTPNDGESKSVHTARCVKEVMGEGKTQDQAVGQCEGMWDDHHGSSSAYAPFVNALKAKWPMIEMAGVIGSDGVLRVETRTVHASSETAYDAGYSDGNAGRQNVAEDYDDPRSYRNGYEEGAADNVKGKRPAEHAEDDEAKTREWFSGGY